MWKVSIISTIWAAPTILVQGSQSQLPVILTIGSQLISLFLATKKKQPDLRPPSPRGAVLQALGTSLQQCYQRRLCLVTHNILHLIFSPCTNQEGKDFGIPETKSLRGPFRPWIVKGSELLNVGEIHLLHLVQKKTKIYVCLLCSSSSCGWTTNKILHHLRWLNPLYKCHIIWRRILSINNSTRGWATASCQAVTTPRHLHGSWSKFFLPGTDILSQKTTVFYPHSRHVHKKLSRAPLFF